MYIGSHKIDVFLLYVHAFLSFFCKQWPDDGLLRTKLVASSRILIKQTYSCVNLDASGSRSEIPVNKPKANWSGHILRRNRLLKQVIEGKIKGGIEATRRWGRRRRNLLDELKKRRGYSHLKKEALDWTMWRARFGRGFGPAVRQTAKWMNRCFRLSANFYLHLLISVCVHNPQHRFETILSRRSPNYFQVGSRNNLNRP
jgi:hypothetical protein